MSASSLAASAMTVSDAQVRLAVQTSILKARQQHEMSMIGIVAEMTGLPGLSSFASAPDGMGNLVDISA